MFSDKIDNWIRMKVFKSYNTAEISDEMLRNLESNLNIMLPGDCKKFLRRQGSIQFSCGSSGIFSVDTVLKSLKDTIDERVLGLPGEYVVMEKCDEKFYCLDTGYRRGNSCRVILWDMKIIGEKIYDSFSDYVFDRMQACLGKEKADLIVDQQQKLFKLKSMKLFATGLLGFMLLVYLFFKRLEPYNFIFSSIAAFSEAAMVGALADWFAVVALFRHPLGMSWIPHTAIIKENRDRIGDSLSNFVVSNFFSDDVIRNKLDTINISESILVSLKTSREAVSRKIIAFLPDIVKLITSSDVLSESVGIDLRNKLKKAEVYPLTNKILQTVVSSELHVPIVKQLMSSVYKWVSDHKEKTVEIIEGMNKTFTFPMVGEIVYKFLLKTLSKLIDDMEKGAALEFNREILYELPARIARDYKTSKEWEAKVEKLKSDILDSEAFSQFVHEEVVNIREFVITYCSPSNESLNSKISVMLDSFIDDVLQDQSIRENIDNLLRDSIFHMAHTYRYEIARLISDTVRNWPEEDMVERLETQVGGDLQYIRINGTVIGGLVGLVIHLLSQLIY